MTINHTLGSIKVSDDTLLIFIDETGNEELQDPNFPIFGFGGCMCLAGSYASMINEPWKKVESFFPKESLPLHAADLKPELMTNEQMEAIDSFFKNHSFGRFANVVSNKTIIKLLSTPEDIKLNLFQLLSQMLYNRIADIAKWIHFNRVIMIFEASERTKTEMVACFSPYGFNINGKTIPIERLSAPKGVLNGLTVADFVVHTAGATVHTRIKTDNPNLQRRDFDSVFRLVDKKYQSFFEMKEIVYTPLKK